MSEGFWIAIFGLAWPLVACLIFLQFRPTIESLLKRDQVSIKIAGFEFTSQEAVNKISESLSQIQKRISEIDVILSHRSGVEEVSASGEGGSEKAQNSRNLLWVDDFPSNNALLIEGFRKDGIEVILSLDTKDAMRKLELGNINAVISDLGRNEGGVENPFAGLELLKLMSQLKVKPAAIIFAGQRGIQNRDTLMAAGAEKVTSSPIDVINFVAKYLAKT